MSEKPDIRVEMAKAEYEPLLPIEKKLIAWSLGLGVFLLLIVLAVLGRMFPPV